MKSVHITSHDRMQPLYDGCRNRNRIDSVIGVGAMTADPFHTDPEPVHRRSHISFPDADHADLIRRIRVKSPDALHIIHHIRFQYLHGSAGILLSGLEDEFNRTAQLLTALL